MPLPFTEDAVVRCYDDALVTQAITCAYGLLSHCRAIGILDLCARELLEAPLETPVDGPFAGTPLRIVRGTALAPWLSAGLLRLVGAGDVDWQSSIVRSFLSLEFITAIARDFEDDSLEDARAIA
jgi:hypothetical protein